MDLQEDIVRGLSSIEGIAGVVSGTNGLKINAPMAM